MNDELSRGPVERIVGRHTPGPWRLESDPVHYDTISTVTAGKRRTNKIIDQMIVQVGGFAVWEEQEANARLIAAAPDLLEALQNLLAVRRGEGGTKPNADALADAAVAKALGVPPNS